MVTKIKIYNNFNISKSHKSSILLIGNFDGLHIGHQKLFKIAKKYKKKKRLKVGVITFDPIPKMFFNKKLENYKILNLSQKINYLKNLDVDFIILKKFNLRFSKIKAHNFIKKILHEKLDAKYIFISNNFKFGNKREGDLKLLKNLQKKYNYKIINPTPVKKNNKIISSTLIRNLLSNGKLERANKLLQRNWSIQGVVKRGREMGKKIGFPTCNINLGNYIIAKPGVYAVRVYNVKGKKKTKGNS